MRARFTTSIAGEHFSFVAGATVSVAGEEFTGDTVPAAIGRQWMASGVLESIGPESAAVTSNEVAAHAAVTPRRIGARR